MRAIAVPGADHEIGTMDEREWPAGDVASRLAEGPTGYEQRLGQRDRQREVTGEADGRRCIIEVATGAALTLRQAEAVDAQSFQQRPQFRRIRLVLVAAERDGHQIGDH
jgi:hypothetical protein